jgi:hypothetical protein
MEPAPVEKTDALCRLKQTGKDRYPAAAVLAE